MLLLVLLGHAAPAHALDLNTDGLSDVWEWFYDYVSPLYAPYGDVDGDGTPNDEEEAWGTDPFSLSSHKPQLAIGAPTPDLSFSFPSVRGIRYKVQDNPDLVVPWNDLDVPLTGNGSTVVGSITGPFDVRYFLRLQSYFPRFDVDVDGLDAYEEALFGSSDTIANSDTDSLTDRQEFYLNQIGIPLNPALEFTVPGIRDGEDDSDLDGVKDKDELTAETNPTSPASYPASHPDLDLDGDGLKDAWEILKFGNITGQTGNGNPDGDRLTNLQEMNLNTNPNTTHTSTYPDGLADQDADGIIDLWELEDATDPFSAASLDLAKNYIVLWARMEHRSSWGPVSDIAQFNGTVMRAAAIGYEEAQRISTTGTFGLVNDVSSFVTSGADFKAERYLRFRKGVDYSVNITTTSNNLPFISGKYYWRSTGNSDELGNKFFRYDVTNRQVYAANNLQNSNQYLRKIADETD